MEGKNTPSVTPSAPGSPVAVQSDCSDEDACHGEVGAFAREQSKVLLKGAPVGAAVPAASLAVVRRELLP